MSEKVIMVSAIEGTTKEDVVVASKLVRLTPSNHRILRLISADRGTTIQALVNSAVEQIYGGAA